MTRLNPYTGCYKSHRHQPSLAIDYRQLFTLFLNGRPTTGSVRTTDWKPVCSVPSVNLYKAVGPWLGEVTTHQPQLNVIEVVSFVTTRPFTCAKNCTLLSPEAIFSSDMGIIDNSSTRHSTFNYPGTLFDTPFLESQVQNSEQQYLKRVHPKTLNPIETNDDNPDNQLQGAQNIFEPSTSASSSLLPYQISTSSQCSEPPSKRSRQLTLFGSKINIGLTEIETNDINKSLIKMIVFDYQPLSVVENVRFLEYTKKLQPLYSVPSRKQLTTKLLPQEYDNIHSKLKSILETIADLSITNDMWTSDCNKSTIVGHFKHSSYANGKLREFQLQMNLPILKVKQDIVTQWNSSLIMIERLIDIKTPLSATMSSLPRAPDYLNASEWEIILDCIHILKPFETMTAELSGENYVTISSIIPLIRGLQHILKNVPIENTIGEAFKNILIDVVSRRLRNLETNKIVAKATFLDPRFKKTAIGLLENANNAQKWISDELTTMVIHANNDNDNTEVNIIQSTTTASTSNTSNSIWDHFDNKVSQVQSSSSPSTTSTLNIRQYLEMPLLDRKKNPLHFWK
ncbi:hypothetical protein QTP88_015554 [Uroleucon formosanum]